MRKKVGGKIMSESTVRWHDYCPRCKTSTPTGMFAFGKIKLCNKCKEEENNIGNDQGADPSGIGGLFTGD